MPIAYLDAKRSKLEITSYNGNSGKKETSRLESSSECLFPSQTWNFFRQENNQAYVKGNVFYEDCCRNNVIISPCRNNRLVDVKNAFVFVGDSFIEVSPISNISNAIDKGKRKLSGQEISYHIPQSVFEKENLIEKDVSGKIIADIGGRTDDFVEQMLLLNKKIKKAYVTDLCSFTTRSKNHKINFVVQSSLTKMPFIDKTIDTIILSMVLHHLKRKHQKEMVKNLISSLSKKGGIILIEDTYPEKINLNEYDKITKDFLKFRPSDKKRILYFYDWFGNRLMRNRDNISLFYNYRTMEEWKKLFEKFGMRQIKSDFIKKNESRPDIFPPKAIMVFQK